MRLAGGTSITALHNSITSRGELYTRWGDHVYLPSGFSESLMKWGTSLAWQDGEWSRWSFMLDRMAWDPGIERSLHIRAMQRTGKIQWRISNPGTFCSDSGEHQLERRLVQALLEEKQFLAGRIVIFPISSS